MADSAVSVGAAKPDAPLADGSERGAVVKQVAVSRPGGAHGSPAAYDQLINSINGVVWELDVATFSFLYVSPQVERMLGYPVAEWYETPSAWVKHLHDEDRDQAVAFCMEQTSAGRDHEFEYRMVAADGHVVWLQDTVTVVLDGGRPVRLRGVMYDITPRKAAEEERTQSAWELQQFFDLSTEMLCICDLDGNMLRVNHAYELGLGYTFEEVRAIPKLMLAHPDDQEAFGRALEANRRGESLHDQETRFLRKDGTVRWLQWSSHPNLAHNRIYAAARDITERRARARHQQALRQVATAIAEGIDSEGAFATLAQEAARVNTSLWLLRFESADAMTVVAPEGGDPPREVLAAATAAVRSGAAVRDGNLLAVPIVVRNRPWGTIAGDSGDRPPSDGAEARLADHARLMATAIANGEARAEVAASRARLVTAGDQVRRRIARDLHDGVQQHLVALALQARTALTDPIDEEELVPTLSAVANGLTDAFDEVREVARGIHPAILSSGGLGAAVSSLARRSPIPVEVRTALPARGAIPEPIELAAYYVVSEAVTNAIKHAGASQVRVELEVNDGQLELTVSDDGVGGARPGNGLGLLGLADRVEALGGQVCLTSPAGAGTTVRASLPLRD